MATVKIDRFGGIVPRVHPTLLADGMATVAHNCRLKNGKLVPLREPSFVDASAHTTYFEGGLASVKDAHSLYCWKHTLADGTVRTDFLAFPGRVYFAQGNIADDEYDRVFVTGETGMSWTDASGTVRENCPAAYLFRRDSGEIVRHCMCKEPLRALRCTFDGTLDEGSVSYAHFFISWVDRFGYESPASAASLCKNAAGQSAWVEEPLKYNQGGNVRFQPLYMPVEAWGARIYKTNAGNETDTIQLVKEYGRGELGNLQGEFTIRMDDTQVEDAMPEIEAPPFDLRDMSFVPGNFYAGRAASMPHTVLFSDIDNPANWATDYRYDVRDNVVKLAVTSNSVFALTDGTPYVLTGTAPESMTVASLANAAACVSEKSVVVYGNAVYYASNQGLYCIYNDADSGTVCRCVTAELMTKEQWQALNPASCIMGAYDSALFMFFDAGSTGRKALVFDLGGGAAVLTTHDEVATCLCTDDTSDEMYFVRNAGEEV